MRALLATLLCLASTAGGSVIPLIHAHAHNDYEHSHPLAEALACGFCSIEADVHLVDGKLLVAHDLDQTRPDRTLRSLYLDPLEKRVRANGGRVYRGKAGATVALMIDIKSEPAPTYAALQRVLEDYRGMLTRFDHGKTYPGAVTIIITGHEPRAIVAAQAQRLVACDGSIADLKKTPPPPVDLVPRINARWTELFAWRGRGAMIESDRRKLDAIVQLAHQQKRQVRFWDAPDNPAAWRLLRSAGVDLINTDRLEECAAFLRREMK